MFFKNQIEHLFLKIPLNAFFDISGAHFCLSQVRSRPRYFPRLKAQMTGFRQKSLPRTTSSQRAIPIERRAHFRDPPTRQTAEYSCPIGNPGFKAKNRLPFHPKNRNRPFQRNKNRPICGDKNGQIYPSKNARKWAIECKTCACFLQVGRLRCPAAAAPAAAAPAAGHPSLRSGRPKQAHVFSSKVHGRPACCRLTLSPQTKRRRGSRADPLASLRAFRPLFAFRLRHPRDLIIGNRYDTGMRSIFFLFSINCM